MKHILLIFWLICSLGLAKTSAQTCTLSLSKSYDYLSTGQSSVLSYQGCSGGSVTWDHGLGTGNNKAVSPTTTTTYSATCTPASGSPCSQTIVVHVIDCSVTASASPATIGSGQSSVLSYVGCSGGSVDWTGNNATGDVGVGSGNSITVTPTTNTTYTAACHKDNGYCLSQVIVTVSNCSVTASASPSSINAGQSSVLSYTGCTNGTVSWNNGVGIGNNLSVNLSATTTYQATCTPAGGGIPCTASVTVTVNGCSLIVSASPASINAGQSSILSYTGCSTGIVSWDNGLGTGNNKTVTPSATTTYQATCTPNGGGTPCTATVVVNVTQCFIGAMASSTNIFVGQSANLSYSGCTNGIVSWDNGLGAGTNKTVMPVATTTYRATCVPNGGGTSCTADITVSVSPAPIAISSSSAKNQPAPMRKMVA